MKKNAGNGNAMDRQGGLSIRGIRCRWAGWVWACTLSLALLLPSGLSFAAADEVINRKLNGILALAGEVKSFQISPDGGWLVYVADHDLEGVDELYASGPGERWPTKISGPSISGADVQPDFQIGPDSDYVVYRAGQQLYCVALTGGTPIRLNEELSALGEVRTFQISPDGSRVVYVADAEKNEIDELYSVPLTGGEVVKLNRALPTDGEVSWDFQISPDSQRVVYRADQDDQSVVELYSVPLAGPASQAVRLNGSLASGGDVLGFHISPNGTPGGIRVVYRAYQDSRWESELYSVPLAGPASAGLKLNGSMVAEGDVWAWQISPASTTGGVRVVYLADQDTHDQKELYSVPLAGPASAGVRLSSLPSATREVYDDFQISPNGVQVVYRADQDTAGSDELYSVPLAGGVSTKLNKPLASPQDVSAFQISSNSERVVYRADQDEAGVDELHSVPLLGGSQTKISGSLVDDGDVGPFATSPDSSRAWYLADQEADEVWELYGVPLDGGDVVKLNSPLVEGGDVFDCQFTPNSRVVVYLASQERVWAAELYWAPLTGPMDQDSKLNGRLAVVGDVHWAPQFSPHGGRAVYLADQDKPGVVELYSVPGTGGSATRLNSPLVEGGDVSAFEISPDGSRVVYRADQETNDTDELFSAPLAGPASASVKLNSPLPWFGKVSHFRISPNNKRVVYQVEGGSLGPDALYCVGLAGGDVVPLNAPLAGGEILDFQISPDSSRVVYRADGEKDSIWEIYSVPLAGGTAIKLNGPLADNGSVSLFQIGPNGASGGSRVVYLADQATGNVEELYSVPLVGGDPVKLNGDLVDQGNVSSFQISPNGKRVVYRADQEMDEMWELYSVPMAGPAGTGIKLNDPLPVIGELGIGAVVDYQISLDSSRVVYRADQDMVGRDELYSVPLAGGQVVKLNQAVVLYGDVLDYQISRDSSRVVYRADQESDEWEELYSVPLAGPANAGVKLNRELTYGGLPTSASETSDAQISPDSQWVLYRAYQDSETQMELFRVPLAGPSSAGVKLSGPLLAADADVLPDLAISPDSRWAMYRAEADSRGVEELYASELTSPPVFGWIDDFCASSLEGGWSWISEDASHWSLTARSCFLRILLQQGGLYGEGSTARNVLVRDAPEGDFTIEGHLLFEPAESFQHAGLLVYRNEDDFLGLTRGYCGFAHQNCLGDATDFTYEDMVHGGSNSYPVPAALANEVYLRITRRSGVYTGYVSEDGVFWREAGALEAFGGANPGQIGLFTGTGSRDAAEIPADFAYFRIGGDGQQVYLPLAVKGR